MLPRSSVKRGKNRSLGIALRCGLVALLSGLTERADAQVSAEPAKKDQVSEINAIWNARYQQLKSVEFDLSVTTSVPRGYYSSMERLMRMRGKEQEKDRAPAFPEHDAQVEEQMKVAIDGERILIESSGEGWNGSSKKFIYRTSKSGFNGQITKTYSHYPRSEKGIFQKQGFIEDGRRISDFDIVHFLPLEFWLGPLLGRTPLVTKVMDTTTERGQPLIVAFVDQDHAKLWLDPPRQFLVARIEVDRGVFRAAIEVTYTKDVDTWIPSKWQFVEAQDAGRIVDCEITNVKLNPKIKPGKFEVEFPPETAIQDLREFKKTTMYRRGNSHLMAASQKN